MNKITNETDTPGLFFPTHANIDNGVKASLAHSTRQQIIRFLWRAHPVSCHAGQNRSMDSLLCSAGLVHLLLRDHSFMCGQDSVLLRYPSQCALCWEQIDRPLGFMHIVLLFFPTQPNNHSGIAAQVHSTRQQITHSSRREQTASVAGQNPSLIGQHTMMGRKMSYNMHILLTVTAVRPTDPSCPPSPPPAPSPFRLSPPPSLLPTPSSSPFTLPSLPPLPIAYKIVIIPLSNIY